MKCVEDVQSNCVAAFVLGIPECGVLGAPCFSGFFLSEAKVSV